MNNPLIIYPIEELEKKKVISEAKSLLNSKFITIDQWEQIKNTYQSNLYTPSFFIRILFFIFALIGMTTMIGPFIFIFGDIGENGLRFLSMVLGVGLIFATEKLFIKEKNHYRSGITEAGIYSGLLFITISLISFDFDNQFLTALLGLLASTFATVRYLYKISLLLMLIFLSWLIFLTSSAISELALLMMPFIFMIYAASLYWCSIKIQTKLKSIIFDDLLMILKLFALLLFYLAGNYFVVRQLSESLMNIFIPDGGDIPLAFLFYSTTALIPIAYLHWGIKTKSLLFIRAGLLIIALSIITFKYYFSLGHPEISITIAGALLIVISIALLTYLKKIRNGFTRELLISDKWHSQDLTAVIASQTLGGNAVETKANGAEFNDGQFGGGGAGQSW